MNTHLTEVLGFEFSDNIRPFSCFNIFQSFSLFIFLSSEAYVKTQAEKYEFHIISAIFGLLMCGYTLRFPYNEKQNKEKEPDSSGLSSHE